MTKMQRIRKILAGLGIIMCASVIIAVPELGVQLAILILCVSFIVGGIKEVAYYASMARHMVGGKLVLYKGILLLDLGIFSLTLTNVSPVYVTIYLVVVYLFTGAIDIIRAMESKRLEAPSWKFNLVQGIISVSIALFCIYSLRSADVTAYFFGIGLIYTGVVRIVQACRKTAIVYIQ